MLKEHVCIVLISSLLSFSFSLYSDISILVFIDMLCVSNGSLKIPQYYLMIEKFANKAMLILFYSVTFIDVTFVIIYEYKNSKN